VTSRWHTTRSRLLRWGLPVALGLGLLGGLIHLAGGEAIRQTLASADLKLLALAMLVFGIQLPLMGLRWWAGMRLLGYRAGFVTILRANAGSNLVNFVAPGHFGEPGMAAWLERTGRAPGVEAFSVLVACKALATLLNLGVLLVCLPMLARESLGAELRTLSLAVVGVTVLAFLGLCALLHPRLGERWAVMRRFRATFSLFARSPRALLVVGGISMLKIGIMIGAFQLVYASLGAPVSLYAATFLESVDALGRFLSIWVPANLGIEEAIHSLAASQGLSMSGPVSVSAALLCKGILTVHISLGAILYVILGPLDRVREPSPPSPSPDSSDGGA